MQHAAGEEAHRTVGLRGDGHRDRELGRGRKHARGGLHLHVGRAFAHRVQALEARGDARQVGERERAHHRHAYVRGAERMRRGRQSALARDHLGARGHVCRLAAVFHLELEQPAQRLLARGVHGDGHLLRLVGADGATAERGAQAGRRVRVEKHRIEHPVLDA